MTRDRINQPAKTPATHQPLASSALTNSARQLIAPTLSVNWVMAIAESYDTGPYPPELQVKQISQAILVRTGDPALTS